MATESLIIEINERGARVVKRNVADIGKGARSAEGSVRLLRRALGAIATGLVIRKLIQTADAFTQIQNRIKLVTTSTGQLNAVTDELFNISQRTRSSLQTNADLFNRLALSTRGLGVSQGELLRITESLNQAVAISGASTTEASAGLLQLSQGLASGTLRGDELRSVLEQLPAVADVIAESLGVTRGQLREMGEQGKISAQQVITAFQQARGELADRFAKTVPTISQSFIQLQNAVTKLIGKFTTTTGVSTALAKAIKAIADNLDTLVRALAAVAGPLAFFAGKKGLGLVITGLKTIRLLILANPIGLLITVLIAAVAALVAFSDKITLGSDSLITLQDVGLGVFDVIKDAVLGAADFLQNAFSPAVEFVSKAFASLGFTFNDVLSFLRTAINRTIGLFVGLSNVVRLVFSRIAEATGLSFSGVFKAVSSSIKSVIDFASKALDFLAGIAKRILRAVGLAGKAVAQGIGENFTEFKVPIPQGVKDFGKDAQEAFLEGFNRDFVGEFLTVAAPVIDTFSGAIANRSRDRIQAEAKAAADKARALRELEQPGEKAARDTTELDAILKDLDSQAQLLGLLNRERQIQSDLLKIEKGLKQELLPTERALLESRVRDLQALQEQADLLDEIRGPLEDLQTRQTALDALFASGKITLDEYNRSLLQLQLSASELDQSFTGGLINGLLRLKELTMTVGEQISDVLVGAFDKAVDAIVQFAQTGKFAFKDFVRSVLSDLLRLATRQALLSLLGSFGGFPLPGGGASGSIPGGQFGLQATVGGQGGPDSKIAMLRVTPRETVTVTPAGEAPPGAQMAAAAPQAAPQVTIVNALSSSEIAGAINTPEGKQAILNMISAAPTGFNRALGNAGGR